MSRTCWIIGNWKQQHLREQASAWTQEFVSSELMSSVMASSGALCVGVAPPFTSLHTVSQACASRESGDRCLTLFAQDVAAQDSGAFTGEIGPSMLQDCGAQGALVGHSERRAQFGETGELLRRKVECARRAGLLVVLCVGETLDDRERGRAEEVVVVQLREALQGVDPALLGSDGLLLAYEPVWAIGTGRVATPSDAQAMQQALRAELESILGRGAGDRSLLYGGSVKGENAAALLAQPDIDGLLVGGASLQVASYLDIIRAALPVVAPAASATKP